MLVFDDLHWSDAASIDLIAALLRRGPQAPVLMALAFRPGQAPERLAAALAAPAVQRITVEQLSESAAAELVGRPDAGGDLPRARAATRSTSSSWRASRPVKTPPTRRTRAAAYPPPSWPRSPKSSAHWPSSSEPC